MSWRRKAERLAQIFAASSLHPAVKSWMDARPPRERWGVAVSGGPDSVALLLLLRSHCPRRRLTLLHLDHRVRGKASQKDAVFCRRLAAGLRIPCVIAQAPARPRAGEAVAPGTSRSEAALRALRMAFFRESARKRGLSAIFFGHQLDDVAETMLMRIARGSGGAGLSAPRPIASATREGMPVRLRPLLNLSKAEIVAALKDLRVPYRTDASNFQGDYQRNRMRHRVIDAWAKAAGSRDARAGAALSRELLQEDDDALETLTAGRRALGANHTLLLRRLRGCPRAILRRALHHWLLALPERVILSRAGFSGLLKAAELGRPTRFSLSSTHFAVIRNGNIRLQSGV